MSKNIQTENEEEQLDIARKKAEEYLKVVKEQEEISKLSNEEWIEKTWEFLTEITEVVENLPKSVINSILESGRVLAKAGVNYNHDQNRPPKVLISLAKIAALQELKNKKSSGGAASSAA